jgi:hypothetical protein
LSVSGHENSIRRRHLQGKVIIVDEVFYRSSLPYAYSGVVRCEDIAERNTSEP